MHTYLCSEESKKKQGKTVRLLVSMRDILLDTTILAVAETKEVDKQDLS